MRISIKTTVFLFFLGVIVGAIGISVGNIDLNQFGIAKAPSIKTEEVKIYFCPEDRCDIQIMRLINSAKSSIHVAIYSFTLDSIGDALIAAKGRGIEVKVVMDEEQAVSQYSEYHRLRAAGIDVRLDSNPNYMHNKFAIFDGKIVVTGSYNWTKNATEKNDENLIILASQKAAQQYEQEFEEIFNAAK